MGLLDTLRFILDHPLNRGHRAEAIGRFALWQIRSRLGGPVVCPFVNETRLLVARGMTGATGNIYCGLHEFEEMAFVLHALRRDDVFVDVGANVGSYTVLAAGAVGAETISFEPSPETFDHLVANVRLNGLDGRVTAINAAAGAADGTIEFTSGQDTVNHVIATGEASKGVRVPVKRLSEVIGQSQKNMLMKIDVEGFETAVVAGAADLMKSERLMAVVMELNGSGQRYGYDDRALHEQMLGWGYRPCGYDPFARKLSEPVRDRPNAIYVRNLDSIGRRVAAAPRFHVRGRLL